MVHRYLGFVFIVLTSCGASNSTAPSSKETAAAEGTFDRASAAQALGGVDTLSCHDGPRASGHLRVTFATDGTVLRAEVDQPPTLVGTPVAACVEAGFRAIRMRSFSGSPVTVGKTFSVGRGD